jgi:hypothetical protein
MKGGAQLLLEGPRRRDVPQRKGRAVGERVGVLADEELVVRPSSS